MTNEELVKKVAQIICPFWCDPDYMISEDKHMLDNYPMQYLKYQKQAEYQAALIIGAIKQGQIDEIIALVNEKE